MSSPLSIVIIGARTVRQGTGPWFAKHFVAEGADVKGVLGSNRASATQAQQDLQDRFGLTVSAHDSWDELINECQPDLVAIATPAETHREYLWKALDAELPVFVEKPFVWDDERDNVKDTEDLVTAYEEKRVPLYVNTQWLECLDVFRELYPGCDTNRVESFRMHLSPTSTGSNMVVDALPHAWSMLCHLAGEGMLRSIHRVSAADGQLALAGEHEGPNGATEFLFELQHCPDQPRPFAFSINGCRVDRAIDPADYSISFTAGDRIVPLKDPLAARISRVINLVSHKTYNTGLRQQVLETQLLQQSIEVAKA